MDKLELDLDDLKVDSFQTNSGKKDEQGTVHGYTLACPYETKEDCDDDGGGVSGHDTCGNCDIYIA